MSFDIYLEPFTSTNAQPQSSLPMVVTMKLTAFIAAAMVILFSKSIAAPMVCHGRSRLNHLAVLTRPSRIPGRHYCNF
jgi:hypothetical protein